MSRLWNLPCRLPPFRELPQYPSRPLSLESCGVITPTIDVKFQVVEKTFSIVSLTCRLGFGGMILRQALNRTILCTYIRREHIHTVLLTSSYPSFPYSLRQEG